MEFMRLQLTITNKTKYYESLAAELLEIYLIFWNFFWILNSMLNFAEQNFAEFYHRDFTNINVL